MMQPGSSLRVLSAAARALNRRNGRAGLPALWFFTDPDRTPDPARIAQRLPPGAALVYRHFGAADRLATARLLRRITARRGVKLLIGADARLAARVGADGAHLPERMTHCIPALRAMRGDWLITCAAHDGPALNRARRLGADAATLSPVLPSRSASAASPLGARRGRALAGAAGLPVIALGGVNARTAALLGGPFAGLAAVDGLKG